MAQFDLKGRKALVTGGARGIGASIAEALAKLKLARARIDAVRARTGRDIRLEVDGGVLRLPAGAGSGVAPIAGEARKTRTA